MIELEYLTIELKAQSETVLAIFIYNDGTINRIGDGSLNPNCSLVIGMGNTKEMFEKLNPLISEDFQSYFGRVFNDPQKKGKECSLEIQIGTDSKITGSRFTYGADSMGPPKSVTDFVEKALEVTDAWYNRAGINAEPQKGKNNDREINKFFRINSKMLVSIVTVTGVFLVLIFSGKIIKFIKEGSGRNDFIQIFAILLLTLYAVVIIRRKIKK